VSAPVPAPVAVAAPPEPAARPRGWWRRNRWGLILLPFALILALVGPFKDDVYDQFFHGSPRVPVEGAHGAWVAYADGRMRLLDVKPVQPDDEDGAPVKVPGAKVWQARVGFDAPPDSQALGGCNVFLEDTQGRLYAAGPVELTTADVDHSLGCNRPTTFDPSAPVTSPAPGNAAVKYDVSYFFVMPDTARAAAVRITIATQQEKFARLTAP
jgi:hypothetical protein